MAEETPDPKTSDQPAAKADDGPVARVIEAFGGIRPMANKLSVPVSTVQGWKERDSIPATRHAQILLAAQSHHITLDEVLLQSSAGPGESPGGLPVLDIGPAPSGEAKAAAKQDAPHRSAGPIPASGGSKAPAATPAKAAGGMTIGLLLGALAVVAGFVLAILARDLWQPLLSPAQPAGTAVAAALEGQVTGLEQQLVAQAARLEELGAQIGTLPTGGAGEAVGDLRQNLTALESELGAMRQDLARFEQRPAVPASVNDRFSSLSSDAAQLGERAAALEARLSGLDRLDLIVESLIQRAGPGPSNNEVALMLALIQLREVVGRGAPYAAELDLVSATIGEDAALRGHLPPLTAHAADGVPTVARLSRRFPAAARAIVVAGAGGEGLVSDVLRSLSDVVTVRPVGEVAGEATGAVVARAEARLQEGDLAGALTELDQLQGAAAEAAGDWRAQAKARHDADAALAALGAAVVGQLAGANG